MCEGVRGRREERPGPFGVAVCVEEEDAEESDCAGEGERTGVEEADEDAEDEGYMSSVVAHVVDGVRVVRRRRLVLQDLDSDFDQGLTMTETYLGHSLTSTRSCCDISLGDQLHLNLLRERKCASRTSLKSVQSSALESSLQPSRFALVRHSYAAPYQPSRDTQWRSTYVHSLSSLALLCYHPEKSQSHVSIMATV